MRELAVAVVVVGREHQPVVSHEVQHERQRPLVRLERVVDLLAAHVFAGRLPEPRHRRLHVFIVLVHPLDPVGHPARAGFQEGHPEPGKLVQYPSGDDAKATYHLLERMGHHVVEERVGGAFRARGRPPRAHVDAHRHVQFLGRGEERPQLRIVQVAAGGGVGRCARGHEAQLVDAAFQFLDRLLGLLDRHQRHALQAVTVFAAILREPVVVGPGQGAGVVGVLVVGQAQEHVGAEQHRGVDALQVHVLEPLLRVFHAGGGLGPAAVTGADVADAGPRRLGPELSLHHQEVHPAVVLHHPRRLGAVGLFQVVLPANILLLHVPIGIDYGWSAQ